ncbi:ATP-dependent DNA ligase [Kineosporia sp. A_224]|uniref:ATP-dependent DNA ligase n=1 Tax=Kineosporia sp. A_224 TaxID=1962180 RepID=UPI000B4AFFD1|nr:ATP-dependent DNA ligase [Kineosporia sp. A_224]
MDLPVMPPLLPMLAKARAGVPDQPDGAPEWLYEPKWDGFRCVVFRDGDEVLLGSRNTKALDRYFPEVVAAVKAELPPRCVLDGELVVPREREGRVRLDWDSLSQRIHPAASRVAMLAEQTPAQVVAFDCLALGDDDLTGRPLRERRAALEEALAGAGASVHLSVATTDADVARGWFETFEGAGLDGVVAKRLDGPYRPDQRDMVKVKHHRTADCVVIGYRKHKSVDGVGSLLLGLHGAERMHMVGGASAFTNVERKRLLDMLQEYRVGEDVTYSGEPNRWNAREDHSFVPLRPELVVEIEYDQMEGDRLRHAGRVLRWRTDKSPEQCTYDQLEVPARYDLKDVLAR